MSKFSLMQKNVINKLCLLLIIYSYMFEINSKLNPKLLLSSW